MSKHYEDELEILMLHNPNGGKPQKVGKMYFAFPGTDREKSVEISQVKEDNSMRFHLGYCKCGQKIVAGEKRALILIKTLWSRSATSPFSPLVLPSRIGHHVIALGRCSDDAINLFAVGFDFAFHFLAEFLRSIRHVFPHFFSYKTVELCVRYLLHPFVPEAEEEIVLGTSKRGSVDRLAVQE